METIRRLRQLAAELRRLAEAEPDQMTRADLLDLANRCDAVADHLEGNGPRHEI